MAPAKVTYACSAHYLDHFDAINLLDAQRTFLAAISDAEFRQTVRDFMVNREFRHDYWVKGPRRLSALRQNEALHAERVILVNHRSDVPLKVVGALGEAAMSEAIYNPILDLLADHKTRTLGEIAQGVGAKGVTFAQVVPAIMLLMGAGHLAAVQDEAIVAKVQQHTARLNAHLIDEARGSSDVAHLASPVTGGAIRVERFEQLFLMTLRQGKKQPEEWAQSAWQILASHGGKLLREGKAIESAEENLAELTSQAGIFAEKKLPILKALRIA